MNFMTSADIRSFFLEYFKNRSHTVVPSSSLIPTNDPTLLFTNSGMVQFKNVFTGQEKRDYTKAVTCQKCIRAGGKHNDLENVGHTARHHTFFEMLGNFSFGDYFKEEAIEYAWTLLTKEWGLPVKNLLVTVYAEDAEAASLWKRIASLPDEKIIRISDKSENFWTMGELGPCGPCSEIFYDHGPHIPGGPPGSPEAEGDRFVEIWNLVFMQFEQVDSETIIPLPQPSVDTGMGLERIAAVLQGVYNNFDTDIFKALIEAAETITHIPAKGPAQDSHRVIADHLRSSCFLIADGVLPNNEGRGYVLRRIMRRAMRHVYLLGYKDSLMAKLVPALVEKMGRAYPELVQATPLIVETLNLEEDRFRQTLEKGLKLLQEETQKVKKILPGDIAFKLYDTYGFPLDLTQDVLAESGRTVDVEGFQKAMEHQKMDARKAWAGSGESKTDQIWFDVKEKLKATEFLGYKTTKAEGIIELILKDGQEVSSAQEGDAIILLTNQTPFYGESGGQVGDMGMISTPSGIMEVEDTQRKLDDLIIHRGYIKKGTLKQGETSLLEVNEERRSLLKENHSATHLLHKVLRQYLGPHVTQRGSLVSPDRLRFDFSHPKPLSTSDLQYIEHKVNQQIRKNTLVNTRLLSLEQATKEGAMALFGEKYGEEVRVVSMGQEEDIPFSVELCGGTHVTRTGDIGYFKIISESSVAAGVRRIEALTGSKAEDFSTEQHQLINHLSTLLKVPSQTLLQKTTHLLENYRTLEKNIESLQQRLATAGSEDTLKPKIIKGISLYVRHVKDIPPQNLKSLVDELKATFDSGIFGVVGENDGKVSLVIGVSTDLMAQFNAVDIIRKVVHSIGGQGGGGRPDMAQAGGNNPQGIETLFKELALAIEHKA